MAIPSARQFAKALHDAGVVGDLNRIQRIVIVLDANDVVKIHVQHYGDERLIDLAGLLAGAEVVTSG